MPAFLFDTITFTQLKGLFNIILNFGVSGVQSDHDRRKVRTTNLLNVVAIFFMLLSFCNYFVLKSNFATGPVTAMLLLAVVSLLLSKTGHTQSSFLVFTLYVNLSIFYFCKYHPRETNNYLFYFPLFVSVVLLNNPSFSDKFTWFHFALCGLFFTGVFVLDFPGFELQMTTEQISFLSMFNLISSIIITVILSILLTRLISNQNIEIVKQNTDLIKTKEEVNTSLKEKEILLAELHHRVKNNLAIISGLLNLQDDATTNEEAKEIIADSKTRIMSMALVHRMLYENSELKSLDLGKYTSELILELFHSYNLNKNVVITQEYDKIVLPVSKSIPLGLILNEIVTNSIKYVFKYSKKQEGKFFISIKEKDNLVSMIVKDNGKGFPNTFNAESETLSLGIYLIKTLAEQIDGKVRFLNDSGARIELDFQLN